MIDAGIVPKWPSDAHKLDGELFISKAAAKLMYGKTALSVKAASGLPVQVVSALRETPLKADTTYASSYAVRYRNTASGVGSRLAWVDSAKVPDPRAVLEAALGPLGEFEMLPQPYRPLSVVHPGVRRLTSRPGRCSWRKPATSTTKCCKPPCGVRWPATGSLRWQSRRSWNGS